MNLLYWLILFIFLLPIIEICGLILIHGWIGTFPTLVLVILAGMIGIFLAKKSGWEAYRFAQIQMRNGQIPGEAILDGFSILIGALLLIIPGLLSDLIGILFFIPYTRAIIKMWMKRWLQKKFSEGKVHFYWFGSRKR